MRFNISGSAPPLSAAVTLCVCALLCPPAASAQGCLPGPHDKSPAVPASHSDIDAGQTASVDPDTGKLRDSYVPPPQDPVGQARQRRLLRQRITVTQHPDGSKSAELGEAYISDLHATMVDGKLVLCHDWNPPG